MIRCPIGGWDALTADVAGGVHIFISGDWLFPQVPPPYVGSDVLVELFLSSAGTFLGGPEQFRADVEAGLHAFVSWLRPQDLPPDAGSGVQGFHKSSLLEGGGLFVSRVVSTTRCAAAARGAHSRAARRRLLREAAPPASPAPAHRRVPQLHVRQEALQTRPVVWSDPRSDDSPPPFLDASALWKSASDLFALMNAAIFPAVFIRGDFSQGLIALLLSAFVLLMYPRFLRDCGVRGAPPAPRPPGLRLSPLRVGPPGPPRQAAVDQGGRLPGVGRPH